MVWGCFSGAVLGTSVPVKGNLNELRNFGQFYAPVMILSFVFFYDSCFILKLPFSCMFQFVLFPLGFHSVDYLPCPDCVHQCLVSTCVFKIPLVFVCSCLCCIHSMPRSKSLSPLLCVFLLFYSCFHRHRVHFVSALANKAHFQFIFCLVYPHLGPAFQPSCRLDRKNFYEWRI